MMDTREDGRGRGREDRRSHSPHGILSLFTSIPATERVGRTSEVMERQSHPCWYSCLLDGPWFPDRHTAAIHSKIQHGIDDIDGLIIRQRCS